MGTGEQMEEERIWRWRTQTGACEGRGRDRARGGDERVERQILGVCIWG